MVPFSPVKVREPLGELLQREPVASNLPSAAHSRAAVGSLRAAFGALSASGCGPGVQRGGAKESWPSSVTTSLQKARVVAKPGFCRISEASSM